MKKSVDIKKYTLISVLISLSVVLSYFDGEITRGLINLMPIPNLIPQNFKLGLANIVILLLITNFSFSESLTATILKTVIANLLLGEVSFFVVSAGGAATSFIMMQLMHKLIRGNSKVALIIVSVIGAVSHVLGQMVAFLLFLPQVGIYATLLQIPVMIIFAIVTGIFNGIIVKTANAYLKNTNFRKYEKKSA